jgi:hypothetical protein
MNHPPIAPPITAHAVAPFREARQPPRLGGPALLFLYASRFPMLQAKDDTHA